MKQLFSAVLVMCFAVVLPVMGQDTKTLELQKPIDGVLEAGGKDAFEVVLEANQFVYGEADQKTVDVMVTVYDPDGQPIDSFDNPARGPEPFQFITERRGRYRIEVEPFGGESGRYIMRLRWAKPVATTPEGRLDQLMVSHTGDDRPGAVVAVFQSGEVTFGKAYGMADLTHGIPNTTETVFNLGSVSKQFAGITFAMLAEADSLSLSDEVRKYIPELPDFGVPVTLRNLFNHTSGYREVYGVLALEGRNVEGDILKRSDAIAVVQRQPELQFEPGSEYMYNSSGYVLLTEIAERVTGVPYPDWMQEHVFWPLGMNNTMIEREPGEVIPNAAYSYTTLSNGGYREDFESYAYYGATDVYTNINDLSRWLRNFRTSELGGPGVMERMLEKSVLTSGDTLDYTLGLSLGTFRGLNRIQHSGATGGYRAYLAYYPEIDGGVAVLSNTGAVDVGNIASEVVSTFFSDYLTPVAAQEAEQAGRVGRAVVVASERLDAYEGTYVIEDGPAVRVMREEEGLFVQIEGQSRFAIVALSDTLFQVDLPGVDARLTFHVEPDGRVDRGTLHQNGDTPIRRIEPWLPSADDLSVYTGRFFSEEVEAFYTLTVDNGRLTLHHRRLGAVGLQVKELDMFNAEWPLSELVFERNEDGEVTGFRVSAGRMRSVLFEKR